MIINIKFWKYEVLQEFDVVSSAIAPYFDQPGHGVQYLLPDKVEN